MNEATSPSQLTTARLLQLPTDPELVLVFPGQGSQKVGMGRAAAASSETAAGVFTEADEALGTDLSRLCFEGPEERLKETANTQPAILAASVAVLAAALDAGAIGRRPALVAGHSLGEYSALVASGALEFGAAMRLVRERGRLMDEAGRAAPGTLAAVVGLDEATVEEICRESGAEVANYNAATQTVVGGSPDAVDRACALAKQRGGRGLPVKVSGAFHTSLMEPAAAAFASLLADAEIADPVIPVVGNVSGQTLSSAADARADLEQQIRRPVRWHQSIDAMEAAGARRAIEVGPGKVLTAQLKRSHPGLNARSIEEISETANV
ncbi:MAG TPA: ACP S-malonyltransferase [Dehalococcoidia bacterium]